LTRSARKKALRRQTAAFYPANIHSVNRLEKILHAATINATAHRLATMAVRHLEQLDSGTELSVRPPPPLYKVLLLNDDFTPMDFVIGVLQRFFLMDREQATRVMLKVHNEGAGLAGVYPRDVAETKVRQVTNHAREHQHPLQCVMEENE